MRAIKLDYQISDLEFLLKDLDKFKEKSNQIVDSLAQYEENMAPERLQIILNDQPVTLEQFGSIIQAHEKFARTQIWKCNAYLRFLTENQTLTDLGCLFLGISVLFVSENGIEPDEELVMKLENLTKFVFPHGLSSPIREPLFRTMLTTWTKLAAFWVENPGEQIDQHLLNQMPGYWPNLRSLALVEEPEDLAFVTEMKNLRELSFKTNLAREKTMFLLQSCPSLYFLIFHNESIGSPTFLHTGFSCENSRYSNVLAKNADSSCVFKISHCGYPNHSDEYICIFDSQKK